ncbi:MAG: Mbeg1-like protein [Sphaerochaeta sp.]
MSNIIDYVKSAKDSFDSRPFCELDSLVLSQFSYLRFNGFVPGISSVDVSVSIRELLEQDNLEWLFLDVRDHKSNLKLFLALADSPRFQDVRMSWYVDCTDQIQEKQFSAITFLIGDGVAYVAFRGTDSTFVGWKEDFNMAFFNPVPSQMEGVGYLNSFVGNSDRTILVGGHSKGGNIAVYASMYCEQSIQDRIQVIFSHDGPGFSEDVFLSENYAKTKFKIRKTLPQSSLIGMLLQQQEEFKVVKSDRFWFMQHDPFSWLVEGFDFQYAINLNGNASYFNKVLNKWISSFDNEQREVFVDSFYHVIKSTNAKTFRDLLFNKKEKAFAAVYAIKDIDEDTRRFMLKTFGSLFILLVRDIDTYGLWKT